MSIYSRHSCRCCITHNKKQKHRGHYRFKSFKKISLENLTNLVRTEVTKRRLVCIKKRENKEYVYKDSHVTAEELAEMFKVRIHQIKSIMLIMNQEGLVYQRENRPPHDSKREYRGEGNDSSWMASIYEFRI